MSLPLPILAKLGGDCFGNFVHSYTFCYGKYNRLLYLQMARQEAIGD